MSGKKPNVLGKEKQVYNNYFCILNQNIKALMHLHYKLNVTTKTKQKYALTGVILAFEAITVPATPEVN